MNSLYKRWLVLNLSQLMRHTGVALSTWAGLGISEGKINWHSCWIAFLSGAIIPGITAFLSKGIPQKDDDLDSIDKV